MRALFSQNNWNELKRIFFVISKTTIFASELQTIKIKTAMNDIELIQNKIYEIRGQRVMLDFDL